MSLNSNRCINIPGWSKREVSESSLYYTSCSGPSTYQLRKPTTPSWFRPRCSCNLQEWLRIKTWYILKAHLRLWIPIETLHKNMRLAKSNLGQHFQNSNRDVDIDTSHLGQTMKLHHEQNTPCHHYARAPTAPARTLFTNGDGCLLQDICMSPVISFHI